MSLQKEGLKPIPEGTAKLARKLFPKGTVAMKLRDELGPIYTDEMFAHLFPKRGRGAFSPADLAWITVMQAVETLTDRQAAYMVKACIDWKYALSLELDDMGIDHTTLSHFRDRLVETGSEELVLGPILQVCRERGWLKAGGKQRTDSTKVLASVRSLSYLESVGESMRATLNVIAAADMDWLLEQVNPSWFDRYVHRFELARFPKEESKRKALREQVGLDVQELLSKLSGPTGKESLRDLPEVGLLRQVFEQHYEEKKGKLVWRDEKPVETIISPYDTEARCGCKRDEVWPGYKVHLTETCDQDPACPHLVVNVETTPANVHDCELTEPISSHLKEQDLTPAEQYVDMGYTSGTHIVTQAGMGTEIIGPVAPDGSWQHREKNGYEASDFHLDWEHEVATCPQGQPSLKWATRSDKCNVPTVFIRFPLRACQACPVHEQCSKGVKAGRTLNLNTQAAHQALVERREEQFTPAYQKRYALRAGIEGTMAQAVSAGVRKTTYLGTKKTHLHHLSIAAGINLLRIDAHLRAQEAGRPSRPTRSRTPFARLQQCYEMQAA